MTEASAIRLVVSCGQAVASDYVDFASAHSGSQVVTTELPQRSVAMAGEASEIVLFLGRRLTAADRRLIDETADAAVSGPLRSACIVGTALAQFGDANVLAAEQYAANALRRVARRVVVFRPGFLLSRKSLAAARLRRLSPLSPLVPKRLAGWFLDADELFAAIEREFADPTRGRFRTFALFGPRRPLRDILNEHRKRGRLSSAINFTAQLLRLLLIGQVAAMVVRMLAGRRPVVRIWTESALQSNSFAELLTFCNRHNSRHMKVVGYNNGVVHFGHQYPNRTVVSTVGCDHVALLSGERLKADCGVTVHRATEFLGTHGRELRVVPNYSYVCLGTAFFVPIHGSSNDCCTLAESFDSVTLYDAEADRIRILRRGDESFGRLLYEANSNLLLLRLRLRVKPKSGYRLSRTVLARPSSDDVLKVFRDSEASNVEVRKTKGSSDAVEVFRYYADGCGDEAGAIDLPRDEVGRLWDRLERNRITAAAFHGLVRRFVFHTELFLTEEQFAAFWDTHRALPVRKVQLRRMHESGLPHSRFGRERFVSADLFTLRRHRAEFERHLATHVGHVKTNPGKHSV